MSRKKKVEESPVEEVIEETPQESELNEVADLGGVAEAEEVDEIDASEIGEVPETDAEEKAEPDIEARLREWVTQKRFVNFRAGDPMHLFVGPIDLGYFYPAYLARGISGQLTAFVEKPHRRLTKAETELRRIHADALRRNYNTVVEEF